MDSLTLALPHGVAEAHTATLTELLNDGAYLDGEAHEFLGYTTGMDNPRARILASDKQPWNVVGGIARFTWLIAGSERLEDIAYYEPRVRNYSDDGLIVPGSSYGRRIFAAAPGLNQIKGVIEELRERPASRRAAAVVWLPEDAIRQSNDIPCTFGLFFHVRNDALTMTTIMRSNNATTLLPYNFFEFSLVGEMIASELGIPFARYVHWAASMHCLDKMAPATESALADGTRRSLEMPAMPVGDALEQGVALATREAELRHASTQADVFAVLDKARETLKPYWLDLFHVLYAYGLAKRGLATEARAMSDELPDYFQLGSRHVIDKELAKLVDDNDSLFGAADLDANPLSSRATLVAAAAGEEDEGSILWVARQLDALGDETGAPATTSELIKVMERLRPHAELAKDELALAARGPAVRLVTVSDVREAFNAVRQAN